LHLRVQFIRHRADGPAHEVDPKEPNVIIGKDSTLSVFFV
jgi:hypothetical protein